MALESTQSGNCHLQTPQQHITALRARMAGARAVLVDPQLSQRNLFVAHFLAESNARLWWVDCTQGIETLDEFLYALLTEAGIDAILLQEATEATPEQIAQFIQPSLKSPVELILEAWDAISDPAIEAFLLRFIRVQPSDLQIILLARYFDLKQWEPLLQDGSALYFTDLPPAFVNRVGKQPFIRALAFGRGSVYADGRPIIDWGRKHADDLQRLFWYILEHRSFNLREASVTLFPEQPERESSKLMRRLLKRLTEVLGAELPQPLLRQIGRDVFTTDALSLLCYDVQHFEQAWDSASTDANRIPWLRKMVQLHRAPYLYRSGEPRIRLRRQTLLRRHAEALEILVRERLDSDDEAVLRAALGDALRAIRAHPMREDLYRHAMQLYERLGTPEDALALYELLQRRVRATSPQTDTLYQQILQRTQR